MANQLLTTSMITKESLRVLAEKLTFLRKINRTYDDSFAKSGAKIGDTLRIRVPGRGQVREGRVMDLQPLVDNVVPLTVATQRGIDLGMTSAEMALDLEEVRERYIEPRMADLAANIEASVLASVYDKVSATVGDAGALDDFSTILRAGEILDNNLAPRSDRIMLLNASAERQAVDAFKLFFNHQGQIGRQYEEGEMGRAGGFNFFGSTLLPTHTRGTATAAYDVNGANQTGSTINIDTGTGTFTVGDVVTFAGSYAVHPQTKANLGYLKQFVVTEASAGGTIGLKISPALTVTGPEQNVTASPTDGGDVVVFGTISQVMGGNLAFTRDAFAFVTADLPLPPKKDASRMTYQGISLRFINDYDTVNDMFISRVDVLFGSALLRDELAVRVPNNPTL